MAYRDLGKLNGRVRVTRRILSEPDDRNYQTVLAREGEIVSLREAYRRRIPEDAIEPEGPAGKVAFAQLAKADLDEDAIDEDIAVALAEAEAAARQADRDEQQKAEGRRAARARGEDVTDTGSEEPEPDEDAEFPLHRGGPNWTLSDGSIAHGSREDAERAEAALHEDTDIPDSPDEDTDTPDGDGSDEDATDDTSDEDEES